jgi:hypothetical protein
MTGFKLVLLTTVASLHLVGATTYAQQELHDRLQKHAGFTDADLRAMEQGEVVTKVLETNPLGLCSKKLKISSFEFRRKGAGSVQTRPR